jgi:hypothetical protein
LRDEDLGVADKPRHGGPITNRRVGKGALRRAHHPNDYVLAGARYRARDHWHPRTPRFVGSW